MHISRTAIQHRTLTVIVARQAALMGIGGLHDASDAAAAADDDDESLMLF